MNDEDYLLLKLQEGEGYHSEFKEKISNLDREMVAFANASGGELYLGVNDQGKIVGLNITNNLLSQIYEIARNCDPSIEITVKQYKPQNVLAIFVKQGDNKPYKCKDGFFLRVGPNSQKLKRDEVIQLINNSGKINFDEICNGKFNYPDDFSKEAFLDYLKKSEIYSNASIQDILFSLNLAKQTDKIIQMTNTGILFFAKNPQRFFPEAYITAIQYKSNDRFDILDKKDFSGSLISQIEESLVFVMRHMSVASNFSNLTGGARKDIYDYPIVALREAIINAVTHRDYLYDGAHIYIHMYPNHIDIENPGELYHGITVNDLGKRSVRRNRLIADLLHRARYIERIGSGFDRMKHTLLENKNPPLEVSATNFFNIRFYKRQLTFDLQKLSHRQLLIYQLFQERALLTKREIAVILKISDDTAIRDLKALLAYGIIRKQGIGKSTMYSLNI